MNETATIASLSGRYRLDERIGSGGAGEVWAAQDEALARRVAVKVLHPALQDDAQTVERFKREAAAAARLNHPNIVVVYDVGHDEGRDYLVMEHVDGPPLSEVLRAGPMSAETVAALGAQVADALACAHDVGLIHRDIKPANVLIARDGMVKVADFGIAKAVGDGQARLTATGTIVGSAAYVAPEQLRDHEIDGRADIYALGLLLHECLTGHRPFAGGTPAEVAARRLSQDPTAPSELIDLPPELDDLIVMATRRDRDERFNSAAAMAAALRSLAGPAGQDHLSELARVHAPRQPEATAVLPKGDRYGTTAADATRTAPLPTEDAGGAPVPHETDPTGVLQPVGPVSADSTPVEAPPERQRSEPSRSGGARPRTRTVAGTLLVLAALAAVALASRGADDGGAGGAGQEPAGPIPVADASDYDPFGGDGEHPEDVPRAHDGDPGTAWNTQIYDTPELGGLKTGVGVWFDLGESAPALGSVELLFEEAGSDVQVFVGATPPEGDPNDWGTPAVTQANADQELTVPIPEGVEGRYVLIWITRLSGSRTELAEVTFLPR